MIELPVPDANLLMKTTTGGKHSDSFPDCTKQCHDYNSGKIWFGLISDKHGRPPWQTEVRSGPAVLNLLGRVSEGWGMDDKGDVLQVHAPYRNREKGLSIWHKYWTGQNNGKGEQGGRQPGWLRHTHMHESEPRVNVRISQFKLGANWGWVKGRRHDALWMKPCTDRGVDDSAKYMTQVLGTLTRTLHHHPGQVPAFLWVMSDLWVSRLNSHHS